MKRWKLLPPKNSNLFIADLHLSPESPALPLFLQFLQGPAKKAKALYILGDLFDAWLGEDIDCELQQTVKKALQTLAGQGVKLFFMAGNRDFLIPASFFTAIPCQKLSDPTLIDLHGVPTLLTHGDLFCTKDRLYQYYRYIVQRSLVAFLFLKLPRALRQKIGQVLRQRSQSHQKKQPDTALDVFTPTVKAWAKRYAIKQLIHGHTHRPAVHVHDFAKRIVLGDWGNSARFVISTEEKTILADFSEKGITF